MLRTDTACAARLRLVASEGRRCYGKLPHVPSRRLILVDIENYCGKGSLRPEDVSSARESISRELELLDEDLVVIGTSHSNNFLVCGTEWEGPRHVLKRGHDGADIALIDASREYRLDTFASVIIVSGDGIFTDFALIARTRRKAVTVVAERGHLSQRLRLAATVIKYVQPHVKPAA